MRATTTVPSMLYRATRGALVYTAETILVNAYEYEESPYVQTNGPMRINIDMIISWNQLGVSWWVNCQKMATGCGMDPSGTP